MGCTPSKAKLIGTGSRFGVDQQIKAVRFNGSSSQIAAIKAWMEGEPYRHPGVSTQDIRPMIIPAKTGDLTVAPGDWIVKDDFNKFHPMKPDAFAAEHGVLTD